MIPHSFCNCVEVANGFFYHLDQPPIATFCQFPWPSWSCLNVAAALPPVLLHPLSDRVGRDTHPTTHLCVCRTHLDHADHSNHSIFVEGGMVPLLRWGWHLDDVCWPKGWLGTHGSWCLCALPLSQKMRISTALQVLFAGSVLASTRHKIVTK